MGYKLIADSGNQKKLVIRHSDCFCLECDRGYSHI